jgi:flavin reductase (DIM6/NTAB) family NADH-FMN oxidoreductase RutF
VGTCSGLDVDKFARFGLTPVAAKHVPAPLIQECLANIECQVVDIVRKHDIGGGWRDAQQERHDVV